ncbi:MAG: hypothetical protein RI885_33 [Actinomycetota bacterium]
MAILDASTRAESLSSQTTSLNQSLNEREFFDLTYQFLRIAFDLVPVALVMYLLWSTARPHLGRLGIRFDRTGRDLASGALLAVVIGVPGIGVYLAGRAFDQSLYVAPSPLDAYWWTVPILILSAFRAAATEEFIVIGYLFARLRDLGWNTWTIIVGTALLRGTYHLYQGVPAFIGNVAMGVLFGWLYSRTGRVLPLVVAHLLIDIAVFVGYPWAVGALPDLFGPPGS